MELVADRLALADGPALDLDVPAVESDRPVTLTERERFRIELHRQPLLLDGAMGTLLFSRGIPREACLEELVLTRVDLVRAIHREYVEAGADAIETNTFGANRFRLAEHGLEALTGPLNRRAAQLVREAREAVERETAESTTTEEEMVEGAAVEPETAEGEVTEREVVVRQAGRPGVLIAGSIGPLVPGNRPTQPHPGLARAAFREQIEGLLEGGVDLFVLETFERLDSLLLAIEEARRACDLPIVASMTFGEEIRGPDGSTPETAAAVLAEADVDAIGVNCGAGPLGCLEVLDRLGRPSGGVARSIVPSAGLPRFVEDRPVYAAGPDSFAEIVPRMLAAGARILGGCCGTTPLHTRAMRAAIDAASG